eukprot:g3110.t1
MEALQSCCFGMRDKIASIVRGGDQEDDNNGTTNETEEDNSWRERDDPTGVKIDLNVYDVSCQLHGVNAGLHKYLKAGAYHGGVVVHFGTGPKEISFGGCKTEGATGMFLVPPKKAPFNFKETIDMGHTPLSLHEIFALLKRMENEWLGTSYSLVHRNCCHFSEALCIALKVPRPFPKEINRLAKLGSKIDDRAHDIIHAAHEIGSDVKSKMTSLFGKLRKRLSSKSHDVAPPKVTKASTTEAKTSSEAAESKSEEEVSVSDPKSTVFRDKEKKQEHEDTSAKEIGGEA